MIYKNHDNNYMIKEDKELNYLICDYLIKNSYFKTYKLFKKILNISVELKINNEKPLLSDNIGILLDVIKFIYKKSKLNPLLYLDDILEKLDVDKYRLSELEYYTSYNFKKIKFKDFNLIKNKNLNLGFIRKVKIYKNFLIIINDLNIYFYNLNSEKIEFRIIEDFIHNVDVEECENGFFLVYIYNYYYFKTYKYVNNEFLEGSNIKIECGIKDIKIINKMIFVLNYKNYIKCFSYNGEKIHSYIFYDKKIDKIHKNKNYLFIIQNNEKQLVQYDVKYMKEIHKLNFINKFSLVIKENNIFIITKVIDIYYDIVSDKKIDSIQINYKIQDLDLYKKKIIIIANNSLIIGNEEVKIPNIKFINIIKKNNKKFVLVLTQLGGFLVFKGKNNKSKKIENIS